MRSLSASVEDMVVPSAAMDPKTASQQSRAKKTHEKHLSEPFKGKINCGDSVGYDSNKHLAIYFDRKHKPNVVSKIDVAVAKMRGNNKL